jgi:hypothetical protein
MAQPLVWCELRCFDQKQNNFECIEGDDGQFVSGGRGIQAAIREAKAYGWTVVDGQLSCPSCSEKNKSK